MANQLFRNFRLLAAKLCQLGIQDQRTTNKNPHTLNH